MICSGVSGGHVNPAISFAIFLGYWNHPDFWFKFRTFIVYPFAQVLGMTIGVVFCYLVAHKNESNYLIYPEPAMLCPPTPSWSKSSNILCDSDSLWSSFFTEVICTFFYINVVLSVCFYEGADKISGAVTIVLVLFTMICTAAPISGGCINPATGLVQLIYQKVVGEYYYNSVNNNTG